VEQLDAALGAIARADRGIVFYLLQEGRGAGFAAKARDRMIVQASGNRVTTFEAYAQMGLERDLRRYEEVGFLCRLLGVRGPLTVLTNNPDKLQTMHRTAGIEIAGSRALPPSTSPYNLHYISSKSRSGHRLEDPGDGGGAALPEPVVMFEPHALADDPRFVLVASYLLPIRAAFNGNGASEPHWFRLHAYYDLVTGAERVVLTYGRHDARDPQDRLVRLQRESLLERFPLAGGGATKCLWRASVRQIVERGAGVAVLVPPAGFTADLREVPGDPLPAARLAAHHLQGRAAHPLLFVGEPHPAGLDVLDHDRVPTDEPLLQ
jgi:GTP cyclohydrolase II